MTHHERVVDARRAVLEQEFGFPFLTVPEATARLGLSSAAIYVTPEKYQLTRYDGSAFVPASVVEAIEEGNRLKARSAQAGYLEIRGVEHHDGVGRIQVVRFLCIPCRRYFHQVGHYDSHDCSRS